MNFQNIEYFLAVAKEHNITRAAEKLDLTQQALSNQIARLENELGTRLFDRKHNFELTYAGKFFLKSATQMIDISRQTEAALSDISKEKRGEIKIGTAFTRGQAVFPLVFPEFQKTHPDISISIAEDTSVDLQDALDTGLVDVIIDYAPFRYDSIEYVELMAERTFLVVPKNILREVFGENYKEKVEAFNKDPVLTVFKDCPFILLKHGEPLRTIMDNEFKLCNISPNIIIETENVQTTYALASTGFGISVIPELYSTSPYVISGNNETFMHENVEVLNLSSNISRTSTHICIAYNANRYQSRNVKDFISLCRKNVKKLRKE